MSTHYNHKIMKPSEGSVSASELQHFALSDVDPEIVKDMVDHINYNFLFAMSYLLNRRGVNLGHLAKFDQIVADFAYLIDSPDDPDRNIRALSDQTQKDIDAIILHVPDRIYQNPYLPKDGPVDPE